MEHVRALYRMANESWRGSPEFAALTAAIVSLSTPEPESDEAWLLDPRTVEAKAQWDAVARALGADVDDPDAVLAAAKAWRAVFIAERAARYREGGKAIEQARIHAETDAACIDTLAQQPASDGGFTAADMMVARQEGRREARRRAAMFGPAATLAERVARVAALLDGHGPMAESAAATLRNALASYDVAIAGQQGDRND